MAFDEAFEDTTPIIDEFGEVLIEHSVEGTYKDLGGFAYDICGNCHPDEFIAQLKLLKHSDILSAGTCAITGEILFFNQVTRSFVILALVTTRTPAGLIEYHFDFHKPLGQGGDETLILLIDICTYIQIGLIGLYFVSEVYTLINLFKLYSAEKKTKSENLAKDKKDGISPHEEHVKSILFPSNDQEEEIKAKNKLLLKYYFDEINGKQLIQEGPSLGNAWKALLRRDQRPLTYFICLLIIPLAVQTGKYQAMFNGKLELDGVGFLDIV